MEEKIFLENSERKKKAIGLIHKVYLAQLKTARKYNAFTKTRSEVLKKVLDDYKPVPLDLGIQKYNVRALYSRSDPPPAEKRKQKDLQHNYAAFIGGWCTCRGGEQ